ETETGVCIIRMAEKMDAGDILETVTVPIGPDMTYGELEQALCEAGAKTLLHVIRRFERGDISGIVQDHAKATFAPKLELEECQIDWQKPSQTIHNLVRGVNPHPGAWTFVDIKNKRLRLKVNRTKCHPERQGKPGQILAYGTEGFLIACGEGTLELLEIQLEGKRAMSAQELLRGLPREQIQIPCAI
ncbi:MAG: methionyl-tRNA formyltransferase, partial [Parachlamydia sp.]|nr:methionyl-tRNA formyltransferase [Parachlamydia sp.]